MKILVSDFDETFYNDEFDHNIELIKQFVKDGNIFIIATGRSMHDLMNIIKYKDIPVSYYICSDGSTIHDQFLNIIYRKDLNIKDTRAIYNLLVNDNSITNPYIDTTTGLTSNITRYANRIIGYYIDYDNALKLVSRINSSFKDAYAYLSRTHININNRHTNKAIALSYLKEYYNLDEENIYTIGNDINDVSLNMFDNSYILNSATANIKNNFNHLANNFEEIINIINV